MFIQLMRNNSVSGLDNPEWPYAVLRTTGVVYHFSEVMYFLSAGLLHQFSDDDLKNRDDTVH